MHYRSTFLVGIPMYPYIIGCWTFNPELMRLQAVPRGTAIAVGGNIFIGESIAVLVGTN